MKLVAGLLRAARKPPRVLIQRLGFEARARMERFRAPRRQQRFDEGALLAAAKAPDRGSLWRRLAARPCPTYSGRVGYAEYGALCPGDAARTTVAAERALLHRVDLLGSGPVDLGPRIDWSR